MWRITWRAVSVRSYTEGGTLQPAAITLSRALPPGAPGRPVYMRNSAAMIPGDSAVESVITSGLFTTLNLYNALLIGRGFHFSTSQLNVCSLAGLFGCSVTTPAQVELRSG
jgi:hypothetical protein